jgi:hypothetical protein
MFYERVLGTVIIYMELKAIREVFNEIEYLERKSELLDEILKYYNTVNMTFDIPENWKDINRLNPEILKGIPKTPRHKINKIISELLPYSECENIVNWDKIDETMHDD